VLLHPLTNPQIAVLVMLDEPGGYMKFGGQIAAPVVSKIIEKHIKIYERSTSIYSR
jgi:cell division protein FtsI/penicillin-binding protein 2